MFEHGSIGEGWSLQRRPLLQWLRRKILFLDHVSILPGELLQSRRRNGKFIIYIGCWIKSLPLKDNPIVSLMLPVPSLLSYTKSLKNDTDVHLAKGGHMMLVWEITNDQVSERSDFLYPYLSTMISIEDWRIVVKRLPPSLPSRCSLSWQSPWLRTVTCPGRPGLPL
jgi:hypothetical protein